jgi:hypothetical protein
VKEKYGINYHINSQTDTDEQANITKIQHLFIKHLRMKISQELIFIKLKNKFYDYYFKNSIAYQLAFITPGSKP